MKIKGALYKELKNHLLEELEKERQSVEIVSAYPLTSEELVDLTSKLLGKKVGATNIVDPTIIAGVKVRVGSKIIDLSLQGELEALSERTV